MRDLGKILALTALGLFAWWLVLYVTFLAILAASI